MFNTIARNDSTVLFSFTMVVGFMLLGFALMGIDSPSRVSTAQTYLATPAPAGMNVGGADNS